MRFFYDNVVAIQVAVVCSVIAWLFGGTIGPALLPTVPWLLVILFEVLLCFPQRHAGETTYEARSRVWRRLGRDPLTWLVLAFTVILIIPFFNKGLCPSCNFPEIEFGGQSAEPPVAFIPFCVNRLEHLNVVLWFLPALLAMLTVKHALLKRGKRALLSLLVWNGVALAILGFVQYAAEAPGPLWCNPCGRPFHSFFSTFGYENMAGTYFILLFGISVALWRWSVEQVRKQASQLGVRSTSQTGYKSFWRKHAYLIPSAILFFAALATGSRFAIWMGLVLALAFFVHAFTTFYSRLPKHRKLLFLFVNLVVLIAICLSAYVFMLINNREDSQAKKAGAVALIEKIVEEAKDADIREGAERASGSTEYHAAVACRVWREHPFFGCGGWGYTHFCVGCMTDVEYAAMNAAGTTGTSNVHNDYLQFLAEHGAVGLLFFLTFIGMAFWPLIAVWRKLVDATRFMKGAALPPKPVVIFALPAPTFCIIAVSLTAMLHAMIDCPFRSPAVMTLFFVALTAADGFMPHIKEKR